MIRLSETRERFFRAITKEIPVDQIAEIHFFQPMRQAGVESGVAVVAIREEDRILATTVTALLSVSVDPPLLLVSLGATAQVLPFLTPDRPFAVSLLAEDQGRVASVFADSYPIGAPPFPARGEPLVEGALVSLRWCASSLPMRRMRLCSSSMTRRTCAALSGRRWNLPA